MRVIRLVLLNSCALLLLAGVPAYAESGGLSEPAAASESELVQLPPASLAQWYKPQNKRQVWLHTMFRLRQSMQAVELYLQRDDAEKLAHWAAILQRTYAKLPEMVPEWRNASRQPVAQSLLQAATAGDNAKVSSELQRLQKFCDGCHMEWQPLVTAIYRSPDYRDVEVTDPLTGRTQSLPDAMQQLSQTLGVLKISREDGDLAEAREMSSRLQQQLEVLAGSCAGCHRDEVSRERILGAEIEREFSALRQALTLPHDNKQSGRHLGTIGFKVCGRCHSIHRTVGDLRNWIIR